MDRRPVGRGALVAGALSALGLCLHPALPAQALTQVLDGMWSVEIEVGDPDLVSALPPTATSGYRLDRIAGIGGGAAAILRVTSDLSPLVDRSPVTMLGAPPGETDPTPADLLAHLLAARAAAGDVVRFRHDAVRVLVGWLRETIVYVPDSLLSEPEDVLRARRASCVGLSNLAVAALRCAGIPARRVRGLLLEGGDRAVAGQPLAARLHRWFEVYYAGLGWLMTDALATRDFVDPWHLRLAPPSPPPASSGGQRGGDCASLDDDDLRSWPLPPAELAERASRALVLRAQDHRAYVVDVEPWWGGRLLARRLSRLQHRPLLRVRVEGLAPAERPAAEVVAVLPDGEAWSAALRPDGAASAVVGKAGRVRLGVRVAGEWRALADVEVGPGEVREVVLAARARTWPTSN